VWGNKQEAAFQLLKQKLCSTPILALPKGNEDFITYYYASIKGLGAVLMQREKVIAYVLGIIDLMIQNNKRMKQKETRYAKEGNKIKINVD
ncbi:putative reverse transcriptase domain-containing protein, partial [Tanacetum coccineum]